MATTTEELKINITVNAEEAERKLEALRSKITEIASLSEKGNFQHLGDLAKSIKTMAGSADKLSTVAQNLKDITDRASAFSKSLSGIKDSKDAFAGMSKSLKSAKAALEDAETVSSKGKGMFSNLGTTNISDVASSIVSDFKRIGSAGAKLAQLPFKMLFSPIQGLATRVSGLASGFGHLFHMIGRVAFMRALRGAIRMVTQAIKEGVTAVYDWASAVGNGFANTMNSITTSLTYFRNSIGAAISPILDAIAPVLDAVIDKCVAVINVFNQLIATLTGASTWRKAEKVATSFGGATNNAAKGANNANKAAKELRRTLLGFDEINRLDAPDKGSGSGGSGGGGGGGSSGGGELAFSEQPISSSVKDFAQKLRDAWDKGDFTEIGTIIGEKVGKALLSVPWEEKIQPTAAKVAKSFGTLLNGMFDYTGSGGKAMWDGIAYTIYGAINTALIARSSFFDSVNWNGIGQGIGAALAKVVYNIRWDEVRKNLSAFPNAVITAITGFCTQMSPADFHQAGIKVGSSVAGALIDIKWSELFQNGFKMADRLLQAINGVFEGFGKNWAQIKTGIINGIKSVPANDWSKIGTDIGKLIFNAGNFVANVVDLLVKALEAGHWGRIIGGIWKGIDDKVKAVYGGWPGAAKALGGWVVDHLGTISLLLAFVIAKNMILKGVAGVISGILAKLAGTTLGAGAAGAAGAGSASFLSLIGNGLQLTIPLALLWVVSDVEADTKTLQSKEVNDIIDEMYPNPSKGWSKWKGSKTENGFNTSKSGMGSDGYSLDRYKAAHNIGSYADSKKKGNQTNARLMGKTDAGPFLKPTTPKPTTPAPQVPKKPAPIAAPKLDSSFGKLSSTTLEVTANISRVTDGLTEKQKTLNNGTLTVQQAIDNIKNGDKSTKNWTAIYDYFKGKGVTGSKISNFTAEYTKKIGSAIKAFILKGNTAQYDKKTGSGVKKFTLGKNTAKFDYKNIAFKIGEIAGFKAGIKERKLPSLSDIAFWFISGFTAVFTKKKDSYGKGATGGIYKNGRWQPVQRYASGGLIGTTGQMFIAREAGPELVGTIGGDTAIMNNDQIVSSVSAGVARAVAGVLGGQGDAPIEVIVKLDSEVLYRAMKKGERKASGRYGTVVAIG